MDTVRCKFRCDSVESVDSENGAELILRAITADGDDASENSKFFKYTPFGELKLGVVNKDTASFFEVGKDYYLDLTKALDQ